MNDIQQQLLDDIRPPPGEQASTSSQGDSDGGGEYVRPPQVPQSTDLYNMIITSLCSYQTILGQLHVMYILDQKIAFYW